MQPFHPKTPALVGAADADGPIDPIDEGGPIDLVEEDGPTDSVDDDRPPARADDDRASTPAPFAEAERPGGAGLAADLALPARAGHWDELRGAFGAPSGTLGWLALPWAEFFDALGADEVRAFDERAERLARAVHDNGITYVVHDDGGGPPRPWSVELFPFMVTAADWAGIERGVVQRARLLEAIVADAYGEQRLLHDGLLPAALVTGHPGWLRPMQGMRPAGGLWLPIVAFDLAHGPDGRWHVVSQRTQAPSGLGYLLENRLLVSRLFPAAFRALRAQRLASAYRGLLQALTRRAPRGEASRVVLLTPGQCNETWFEHAYLARYLGITLVEGEDLTVRDERVWLKTLQGLEPVHAILRRLDDDWCDPLELRADSALGVPGLLSAMRAGNVLVANAPGSGFLESPGLLGFLPAIAQRLLGEPLALPSAPTWWCGEAAARESLREAFDGTLLKPAAPRARHEPVAVGRLDAGQRQQWSERLDAEGDAWVAQQRIPLSCTPTWRDGRIVPRAAMLRVFALADGEGGWRVLPGGLARVAGGAADTVSMQRGGGSADTWVLTDGPIDDTTLLPRAAGVPAEEAVARWRRPVSSRAGEHLFWLGRYTERAELATRLLKLSVATLDAEDEAPAPVRNLLTRLAIDQGLAPAALGAAEREPDLAERLLDALIDAMGDAQAHASVAFDLSALRRAAAALRDRLSPEHWRMIVEADEGFAAQIRGLARSGEPGHGRGKGGSNERGNGRGDGRGGGHGGRRAGGPDDDRGARALFALSRLEDRLAAITGAQADRMTRDDGWRLLSIGRHIERLATLAGALEAALSGGALDGERGQELVLDIFDSAITFRARYRRDFGLAQLVDTVVLDDENPRSLAWIARTLARRVGRLPAPRPGVDPAALAAMVPDLAACSIGALCERDADGRPAALLASLSALRRAAWTLSDRIGLCWFTHVRVSSQAQRV